MGFPKRYPEMILKQVYEIVKNNEKELKTLIEPLMQQLSNGCIWWNGSTKNYAPHMTYMGMPISIKRALWIMEKNTIPPFSLVTTCDDTLCVNIKHLKAYNNAGKKYNHSPKAIVQAASSLTVHLQEKNRAIELYKGGMKVQDIAIELSRHRSVIYAYLKEVNKRPADSSTLLKAHAALAAKRALKKGIAPKAYNDPLNPDPMPLLHKPKVKGRGKYVRSGKYAKRLNWFQRFCKMVLFL